MKATMMTFVLAPITVLAGLYGDVPDERHAWAVHDFNRPKPLKVEPAIMSGGAPSDAIVLFDGSRESFDGNWRDAEGKSSGWAYSDEGYFYSRADWKNGGCIFTRTEFGDCQLHIEYRHDPRNLIKDKGPQMRGNSGVFLMNHYEVQVLESYYTSRGMQGQEGFVDNYADGQAGAIYAEDPPLVNPARKPGEWQVYDIVFHQPVWEGSYLVHPGSITVFFNGVLVQDHWEMEGVSTHCRRRPLVPHASQGPLRLQDHGCVVQFRNIWYRPLASRWANTTHSAMSGKLEDVMASRRATAAKLYAKIEDPKAVTAENVKALAEVISYANEEPYADRFHTVLEAFRISHPKQSDIRSVNEALNVLVRGKILAEKEVLSE